MRLWIISFILGLLGLPVLLRLIELDDGFAVLVYGQTTVEMPLWFVFLAMIVFSFASYYLARGLRFLLITPRLMNRWFNRRGVARTHNLTVKGFLSLLEGNWSAASRDLLKAADKSPAPILNYLLAARARLENDDLSGAETLLEKATEMMPEAKIAVGIYHAQLLQQVELHEQAHGLLSALATEKPRHALLQKMLMASYRQRGEAQKVLGMYPSLQKQKILSSSEMESLLRETCMQIVDQTTLPDALEKHWAMFPALAKQNRQVIAAYCRALLRLKQDSVAEELLRKTLIKHWNTELVTLFGLAHGQDALVQLQTAEQWLKNHLDEDALLLALARISQRNQLWAKARDYYLDYIRRTNSAEAQQEMARLPVAHAH
jgi:HemY protein